MIKHANSLKVVAEYGTWIRKDPFREHILDFLKKSGEIQAILSEPPPYESEGYNEWCDSIYILLDLGARIWLCDRDRHEWHMNIGDGEAISLVRNATEFQIKKGYAVINRQWSKGDVIELNIPMQVRRIFAHENVEENRDKIALVRGPLVYCAEWIDNDDKVLDLIIPDDAFKIP